MKGDDIMRLLRQLAPELLMVSGIAIILYALYDMHITAGLIGTGVVVILSSLVIGGES